MNCRMADFIGYLIVLEILLEMRFYVVIGVPKKSGVTRLFPIFASARIANFQDRLVMTASEHSVPAEIIVRNGIRSEKQREIC